MIQMDEFLKALDSQIVSDQQAIERRAREAIQAELEEARLIELVKTEWNQLSIDLQCQSKDHTLDNKKFLWANSASSLYMGLASLNLVSKREKYKRIIYTAILSSADREVEAIEVTLTPLILGPEVRWFAAPSAQKAAVATPSLADYLIRELAQFYVKTKSAPIRFDL